MSNKIEKMHPELYRRYKEWELAMVQANLQFRTTSVDRTQLEQVALFCQGRMQYEFLNKIRSFAGLNYLPENIPLPRITWILKSKHLVTPDSPFSQAFDFVLLKHGKTHWDLKISINDNEIPDYKEAGYLAEQIGGLLYGGSFGDYCHIELNI